MSFGFSVGDFVAVAKLVKDISSSLQDVGGAKDEYQELLRELRCLEKALQQLDKLHSTGSSSTNLDSIKYAALSCQYPLEQFFQKIQKFDKSLGIRAKTGVIKSVADKVRWGLGQKEEVRKIQSYLNVHIGTINILLAEHGLEKLNLVSDRADFQFLNVLESLNTIRGVIGDLTGRLTAQTAVFKTTQAMLAQLFRLINGEFRTSWRSFGEMAAKVCVVTQQSYTVLLEIKSSLAGPDTSLTYFQAPFVVEDALGRKFPVPSEYDFDLLDAIIKQKFKTGPGSLQVRGGNYEYFKTKDSSAVLSKMSCLLPGTAITMAVIILSSIMTDEVCPIAKCRSSQTTEFPGGGRICRDCNVRFSPSKRKRTDIVPSVSSTIEEDLGSQPKFSTRKTKRRKIDAEHDAVGVYKNLRIASSWLGNERLGNDRISALNELSPLDSNSSVDPGFSEPPPPRQPPQPLSFKQLGLPALQADQNNSPHVAQRLAGTNESFALGSLSASPSYDDQSPSFHSSPYLPELETNFMKDFTCCGLTLPSLHDLLEHFETTHAGQAVETHADGDKSEQAKLSSIDTLGSLYPESQNGDFNPLQAMEPNRLEIARHVGAPETDDEDFDLDENDEDSGVHEDDDYSEMYEDEDHSERWNSFWRESAYLRELACSSIAGSA